MSKIIRTNFDHHEMRRDRRYEAPPVLLDFAGSEHETVNWSLGGFLLAHGPKTAPGTVLSGRLRLAGGAAACAMSAEYLRPGDTAESMAFRFVEKSDELVTILDRAVFKRLMGRPRP